MDQTHGTAAALQTAAARIETDTFCEKCGYNLFSLAVERDERLGLLIARCPECGAYHAAGEKTSAGRVWVGPLSTLVLGWVLFLLASVGMHTLFMGLFQVFHIESYTTISSEMWMTLPAAPYGAMPPSRAMPERVFRETPSPRYEQAWQIERAFLVGGGIVAGLSLGMLVAVFMWHLARGWWYFLFLVFPWVAAGLVWIAFWGEPYRSELWPWVQGHIALMAGLETLGMMVGFFVGRPVTRFVLRLVLPGRWVPRLGVLWTVDGKKVPGVGNAEC